MFVPNLKQAAARGQYTTHPPHAPPAAGQKQTPPPPPPVIYHNNSRLPDFRFLKFILIALVFLLPFTSSAQNTPYTVNSYNALQNAINSANVALDADTINITSDITITFDINTIFSEITINGDGHTIYGADTHSAITTSGSHVNLTIKNLTFAENQGAAGSHGGAINHQGGSLTLDNVTIRDSATSHATADGGGLICAGSNTSVTIKNSRIHDNSGRKGGGIYLGNGCTGAKIMNSSIYNNTSTDNGAGIHVATGASVTISNSSVFGNSSAHRGGGIYIAGGTATLEHVTIAGNTTTNAQGSASSETGAGLRAHGGTLHIKHSIIYDNMFSGNQENCRIGSSVTVGTLSHNIVGAGSDSGCTSNADPSDPNLAGPSVHGRGKFFIPRLGSPAIDSIPNADCLSSVTTDQRGEARPYPTGGSCDKGAIEDPGYVPPRPPSRSAGVSGSSATGSSATGSSKERAVSLPTAMPRASTCLTLNGVWVDGIAQSTQCQRVSGVAIGNEQIAASAVDAVDVWGWVLPNTQICFFASGGSFKFIDTGVIPRVVYDLPLTSQNGMSCATIDRAGILVLLPGAAPPRAAPASASPAAAAQTQALSNCMVTTTAMLNFRESPGGDVAQVLPYDVTLTALEKSGGWFKVDYHGEQGWISADYVEPKGSCGG